MKTEPARTKTLPRWRGFLLSSLSAALLVGGSACVTEGPEAAVACAVAASQAADREGYAACFTPRSRSFLGALWGALGPSRPELFPTGGETVTVREVRPLIDPEADAERALVVVAEGWGDKVRELRVVTHALGGRWRIDLWDTAGAQFGLRGL